MAEVVESKIRRHKTTGQTITIFSVLPYGGAEDWDIECTGYTIRWDNGTVGTGGYPFPTKEAAQAHLDRNRHFAGIDNS